MRTVDDILWTVRSMRMEQVEVGYVVDKSIPFELKSVHSC